MGNKSAATDALTRDSFRVKRQTLGQLAASPQSDYTDREVYRGTPEIGTLSL